MSEEKRGRPSIYTPEIAEAICERLATGESLRSIGRDDNMPHESTIRTWAINDTNGFFTQYSKARDIALDKMADDIIEISDTAHMGIKREESESGVKETVEDMLGHRRLQIDARKWYLSKLAPKRYGDKLTTEVTGADGGALQVEDVTPNEAARKIAMALSIGMRKSNSNSKS